MGRLFSGGQFAPAPLSATETATLERLEGTRWSIRHAEAVRARSAGLDSSLLRRPVRPRCWRGKWPDAEPAPLDLRVNLLRHAGRGDRCLAAEGIEAEPTPLSPWGLRVDGRRAVTKRGERSVRAGGDPGRGQPVRGRRWPMRGRICASPIGAPEPAGRRWRWR